MENGVFCFLIACLLVGWLMVALICGMIGKACAKNRGRGDDGFMLGFWLGPLGVILAMFLPEERKAMEAGKQGAPVTRNVALREDPMVAWERQERAKTVLEVPAHLRGRKLDD
jgi:uncharacterized membrane protein YeaQ/YmgE (transglycosylase-associated protein family)